MSLISAQQHLENITKEYWRLSRARNGFQRITVTKALQGCNNNLEQINPAKAVASRLYELREGIIQNTVPNKGIPNNLVKLPIGG